MLLIDNRQPQSLKFDGRLNERVGADNDRCGTRAHAIHQPRPLAAALPAHQTFYADAQLARPCTEVLGVLSSKDFGRRHDRGLVAMARRQHQRGAGNRRLAAADIALQQAVHRRFAAHVGDDLVQRPFLARGQGERQRCQDLSERDGIDDKGNPPCAAL